MKNPDVSIVVPVYGVANYIEKCCTTLFEQTFENIEYIFVNDCTPDRSIETVRRTLERYPHRAPHVKIVNHEVNKGLAAARKTGILNASGTYVLNFDSDDYLDLRAVELLYNKAIEENADMVVCDFWTTWQKRKKYFAQNVSKDKVEYIKGMLSGKILPTIWNKLIKRDLYISHNIYTIDGINLGEDLITTPRLVYYANKIAKVNEGLVYYVQYNTNSYTKNLTEKNIQNLTFVLDFLADFFMNKKDSQVFVDALLLGQLHKKIRMVMASDLSQRKALFALFPKSNQIRLVQNLPLGERITYRLCERNNYELLSLYLTVYKKSMEFVQIIKGRRLS